jgi:hypothetical protein
VEIRLARLRDDSDGIQGEITVSADGRSLHWGRVQLASLSARESLVTKLNRVVNRPWRELLEQACRETAAQLRASAPTIQLRAVRGEAQRHLADKLLVSGETNVVFADGGSGKSRLSMALAVAVMTGKSLPGGLTPHSAGPVLYLDWESCQEEHADTMAGLLAGLDVTGPVPLFYRRMLGALADDLPAIRQEVARLAPVLIVVDSLAPACGAEPESADANIRALNALRSLPATRLVLAHVSKMMADQRGPARPFGSVFVQNLPRNVWEIRRAEDETEDVLTVGLYHRKSNRGRLLPPFGLRFEFGKDATVIRGTDLSQDSGLRERAGLSYGIKAALRGGAKTVPELAEELDAAEDTVRKTLNRIAKCGAVVRVENALSTHGCPVRWWLPA